jgi:chromosome segregation ATPase
VADWWWLQKLKMDENEPKKWLISPIISPEQLKREQEQREREKCQDCEKNKEMMHEYLRQLNEEKKAMDETILMVEKLEREHKSEINELRLLLNFEKDKVVMLQKSLEKERKARIEDLYKQDRERKDFDYVSKDYEAVNALNQEMISEFEVIKNENLVLSTTLKSLQDNKETILNELKKYEDQVNDLETQNQSLRKRLYDTETQRDKFQIHIEKLKLKIANLNAEATRGMMKQSISHGNQKKKFTQTQSLSPIHQPQLHQYSTTQSTTVSLLLLFVPLNIDELFL